MVDQGTPPEGRQFDEVNMIVCNMASHGFLQLSSLEDPLSKAFTVLGFNPSAVRLKRDNDAGFSKTEFLYNLRSEERRVGKECGVMCISRWSPYH